ncbi:hydantoinase/oxoprolinase N-terminal domain-containing protein [Roseovarius dicentrarchi]|uniref:hydantoinase/oxoprolinase N-terminal domain-containing protein n=1 Tax=Roseovarius dicentrarchi TaxID=2250573 RepID=UPI000DEBB67A|nr:hydantoinase/oxoprolinase family protein [Roseovarius dicentrarchi]
MAILLGVDTGGTYTDAVLIRDESEVIASAKALTTRHDLAIGIGGAVANVLAASGIAPDRIALASLSTTLATNALVEGQGGRVGLIYVGFREQDMEGHGLRSALDGDPALVLAGGHNHAGMVAHPLDTRALEAWLAEQRGISAFAVASQFATRNPEHELEIARIIAERAGRPVSCSHHLSAKLNGPKRALTALLNARLIGMIASLIEKAEGKLQDLGITAPLMVVRGDGALISAAQARERPIETILSGPAASIVGARWLTGVDTALVSDIGGTTTDVAVLRGGKPMIDPAGAQVGPWRTMVEAVGMRTTGLGGDSEVHVQGDGLAGGIVLGPRRVLPVSLIGHEAPDVVHRVLDAQLRNSVPADHDAAFVRAVPGVDAGGLPDKDAGLLARIVGGGVQPVGAVLKTRMEAQALRRLVARGLVQVSGVTPSDASHVLGNVDTWDIEAAEKALSLLARRRTGSGNTLAQDAAGMARMIVDQLTNQTVLAMLETGFAEEAEQFGLPADVLARHVLTQRGLDGHKGLLRFETGLNVPVVGLGASAGCYYPAVGIRLGCAMILPEHADVANAIGAVVGRVTIRRSGTVTCPVEGVYRVHLATGPVDYTEDATALDALQFALEQDARAEAVAAGAEDIHITATRDLRTAQAEARQVFLEGEITVEASGRPRIAA